MNKKKIFFEKLNATKIIFILIRSETENDYEYL